ncbi:MAG: AHH domain-containing protein [Polyangiaceae bacterium]|nr:AHH domain-containing protein [Polyangiaceae bacterium]
MKAPPFNIIRKAGQALHHMVAHGDDRAKNARKILDKFKIHIDEAWNGVFLPATTKSPNPKGSIVHSMVHTDKYYRSVERALEKAKSRKDAIRILQRIRETLENGTFFDANL